MSEIYFSIIMYIDDNENLESKFKDILEVSDAKLIVTDPICSNETLHIGTQFKEKYGCRFVYIKTFGMALAEAYNIAIEEIQGRYVNFTLSSIGLRASALESIYDLAEEYGRPKLISLCPWTVNEKGEYVQYRMSPTTKTSCELINLTDTPECLQLFFHGYFIRAWLINSRERHMWFDTKLQEDAITIMLLNLLAEFKKYLYLNKVKLNYKRQMEDNTSAFVEQHFEWWYLSSLENGIIPFAREWAEKSGPLCKAIRIAVLYYVFVRFNCNYNDRNKMVLNAQQREKFYRLAGEALMYVDNAIIWKKTSLQNFDIPRTLKIFLLKLKAQVREQILETILHGQDIYLWTHKPEQKNVACVSQSFTIRRRERNLPEFDWAYENGELLKVANTKSEHVIINIINFIDGKLEIDGTLSIGDFLTDKDIVSLQIVKGRRVYQAVHSEAYGLRKIFGETYEHVYQFHISVPVVAPLETEKMFFQVKFNDAAYKVQIRSASVYAHINPLIPGQYWNFTEGWCLNICEQDTLVLSATNAADIEKRENIFQKELMERSKKGNADANYALELRQQFFARAEEFANRRIWITFDKLYKAGDNGEYIYNYVTKQEDGIEIYYLIKEDSVDYERMCAAGANLLIFGETETLITVLYAEAILTTHASVFGFAGFKKELTPYIQDLFNPVNICIQHGLTVQNIANFQNRWIDNLQLYLCASENEIKNLRRPIYDYSKKSVRLTGLARFDGLVDKRKKQILIAPTWRRNLASGSSMGNLRGHNDFFQNSDYFKIYNRLINDERLILEAQKRNYQILYMVHPTATMQSGDFGKNEYVQILTVNDNVPYETLLTESDILVTDYSGIQFDFAYMKKPILYYHPTELPPHFEESEYFSYSADSFGAIIDNHEKLIAELCDYMSNGCKIKEEYAERADKFFAFKDYSNCERIYHEVLNFLDDVKRDR